MLKTSLRYAATLLTLSAVVGCAQMPFSGDKEETRATSLSDAQTHARGGRDRHHASSQVELGFGGNATKSQVKEAHNSLRTPPTVAVEELTQPQTFIGTIACGPTATACNPVRVVISLHPNGVWRLRAKDMDENRTPTVAQGCWHQIGKNPNRIILQTQNDTVLADLSFSSPNKTRVNVFNYMNPKLETYLSRQPEVDSISELENQTGPVCRSSS